MQLGGKTVFPITLGNGPPLEEDLPRQRPERVDGGRPGRCEDASHLSEMECCECGRQLITDIKDQLAAASRFGLRLWVGLFDVANDLSKQALLQQIVDGLKDQPGLGAWKGCDEPLWGKVDAKGRRRRLRVHPFPRSGPSGRDHPGTQSAAGTVDGRAAEALRGGRRHPRRRHLPDRPSARAARRTPQHGHQRGRRRDRDRRRLRARQGALDDVADRLERRDPAGPRTDLPDPEAGAVHGLPGDHRGSPRARLLRRRHHQGDEPRGREERLELDVLAHRAETRRAGAELGLASAPPWSRRLPRSPSRRTRPTSSWSPARPAASST